MPSPKEDSLDIKKILKNDESNTSLILIQHQLTQSGYSLLRYIARSARNPIIICFEQSPEFYKKAIPSAEIIDCRFSDEIPSLERDLGHTFFIDSLERYNNNRAILSASKRYNIISLVKFSSKGLIQQLSSVQNTPRVTTINLHSVYNYEKVINEYGLKPNAPQFLGVLHELQQYQTIPAHLTNNDKFVIETLVRSAQKGTKLVRRSLDLITVGMNDVEITNLEGVTQNLNIQAKADEKKEETTPQPTNLGLSFNLGLTNEQKAAREAVPLPYLQAQQEQAPIISYDPDSADDWDDEDPDDDLDL